MYFINMTPHTIVLNDGQEIVACGKVARVSSSYTEFDKLGICEVKFGEITDLPEPREGAIYIVSAMVAEAAKRTDVVSPATGHPDCRRDAEGHIVSVPGFVRWA